MMIYSLIPPQYKTFEKLFFLNHKYKTTIPKQVVYLATWLTLNMRLHM